MEKVLRNERQLKWMSLVVMCVFIAGNAAGFYFDNYRLMRAGVFLAIGFAIAEGMSRRVIKELKRENESLKSDASTGSVDTTPPADEPATDE